MSDVAREIAAAFERGNAVDEEEVLRLRYRRALEIARTIPSGTADADLTPLQAAAMNEYEATSAALAALRDGDE